MASTASRCKTEPLTKSKDSRANGTFTSSSPRKNPRRTSARLRSRSLNNLSSLGLPQKPPNGCTEQVGPYQRKRRRNSDEEPQLSSQKARPEKRARKSASIVSDKSRPLNAETLKDHTLREGYVNILELMDLEPDNICGSSRGSRGSSRNRWSRGSRGSRGTRGTRGTKRSASRSQTGDESRTSTGMVDQETTSKVTQKSSYTAAHYRLTILTSANIIFQFQSAPKDVCTQIATVFQCLVSEERKNELSHIARTLHNEFILVLDGAEREEDCIVPFHQALSALGYNDSLRLKKNVDWDSSLKPRISPPRLNLGPLMSPQGEAEDSLDRPSKRRNVDGTYPSPDKSGAATAGDGNLKDKDCGSKQMGPPPIPQWVVKTPRPDISIGFSNEAVVNALQLLGLTKKDAEDLLKAVAVPDARNGGKPLLILGCTKPEVQIRFPFMLVEGKSYATGKNIYEAQNQAAVSGACALEILHRLDDLAQKAKPSNFSKGQHIVFSICTQGPIHELWVHYTTEDEGDRIYNTKIWKSCNMAVECEVPGFLEAVDKVMSWATGKHLEEIAKQLKLVRAAALPY